MLLSDAHFDEIIGYVQGWRFSESTDYRSGSAVVAALKALASDKPTYPESDRWARWRVFQRVIQTVRRRRVLTDYESAQLLAEALFGASDLLEFCAVNGRERVTSSDLVRYVEEYSPNVVDSPSAIEEFWRTTREAAAKSSPVTLGQFGAVLALKVKLYT